ncbi:MAG TPA: FAD-binding oxidoreductase [Acidimicrobiia bacterium]|nr:FAD-binding oxidoreductase [Acidimicrobiia bacterium]
MRSVTALTTDGGDTGLKGDDLDALAAQLRGPLLTPELDGYDAGRQVWNGMIDRRPALIARCTGTADVKACVDFAREHALLVSVKGGGHNIAGKSVCEGGFAIDLSLMKNTQVDAARLRARAGGGTKWGDFDHETQAFGLATTGGTNTDTGIAGLTLGGGIGWLAGRYGLACDNLTSANVVLADGRVVTASPTANDDLFWGLRGGSGNFGIVTSFEYQLHPVAGVLAGPVFHPFSAAAAVFGFYRDFVAAVPDELVTLAGFLHTPEGVPVAGVIGCWNGPFDAGERAVQPMRTFGAPLVDEIQPMPYAAIQAALDPALPPGGRYYLKGHLMTEVSDEAIATLVDHYARVPSPRSVIVLQQIGNAANRVDPMATAFSYRNARYDLVIVSVWSDPAEDATNIRWARELHDAMEPFSLRAVYVNSVGDDDMAAAVRASYRPETFDRLAELKARYDPTNFFRLNPNIPPSA